MLQKKTYSCRIQPKYYEQIKKLGDGWFSAGLSKFIQFNEKTIKQIIKVAKEDKKPKTTKATKTTAKKKKSPKRVYRKTTTA
jgi:hypothetical protein